MYAKTEAPFFLLTRYRQALGIPFQFTEDDISENLRRIAIKHFQTYPFHSLYFNLKDADMPLDRNALIHQMMLDEGGSCYHHNATFQAILEANNIPCHLVECLVRNPRNPEETFALPTHIAIVFQHNDVSYLFDPGWDGSSFSIYPLPSTTGEIIQHSNFQVRRTDSPDFPFTFEEIKPDGTVTPRYDFNNRPTQLENHEGAIHYLNSEDYAFHTLFLFTRINQDQQAMRFVNRRLTMQTLNGVVIQDGPLPEDTSPLQQLTKQLEGLTPSDFKNPALGDLVCQSPVSSLTRELS